MQLDPLPEELSNYTCYSGFPPTGGQWWGSAEKLLTLIASKHGPIYWTVFDRNRLRFERRNGGKELSDFDELAGRLMYETQPQQNGQFSEEQYDSIAERLDREGFRPLKHLEKRAADKLRARNSKHLSFKGPLHTFKDALKSKEFCGAVKKRLSRAKANYQKSHLSRVFAPQPSRPAAP
jgi:hypothetical protein